MNEKKQIETTKKDIPKWPEIIENCERDFLTYYY